MDEELQQNEWDAFVAKCGGKNETVGFIAELYRLYRTNAHAKRELDKIEALFRPADGMTKPTSWETGATQVVGKVFGGGSDLDVMPGENR